MSKQHELYASLRYELPEHPQQLAAAVADITTAWAKMLDAIGLEVEASLAINEVRPKAKARKPKPALPRLDEARGVLKSGPSPFGSGHDADAAA